MKKFLLLLSIVFLFSCKPPISLVGTRVPAFYGTQITREIGSKSITVNVGISEFEGRVPLITGWDTSTDVVNNQITQSTILGDVTTTITGDPTGDETFSGVFSGDSFNTYTAVVHNTNSPVTFDYTQDVNFIVTGNGPNLTNFYSHTVITNAVMNGENYTASGTSWSAIVLPDGLSAEYTYYNFQVKMTGTWRGVYIINPLVGQILNLYDPTALIANCELSAIYPEQQGPNDDMTTGPKLYYMDYSSDYDSWGPATWIVGHKADGRDATEIWNAH